MARLGVRGVGRYDRPSRLERQSYVSVARFPGTVRCFFLSSYGSAARHAIKLFRGFIIQVNCKVPSIVVHAKKCGLVRD